MQRSIDEVLGRAKKRFKKGVSEAKQPASARPTLFSVLDEASKQYSGSAGSVSPQQPDLTATRADRATMHRGPLSGSGAARTPLEILTANRFSPPQSKPNSTQVPGSTLFDRTNERAEASEATWRALRHTRKAASLRREREYAAQVADREAKLATERSKKRIPVFDERTPGVADSHNTQGKGPRASKANQEVTRDRMGGYAQAFDFEEYHRKYAPQSFFTKRYERDFYNCHPDNCWGTRKTFNRSGTTGADKGFVNFEEYASPQNDFGDAYFGREWGWYAYDDEENRDSSQKDASTESGNRHDHGNSGCCFSGSESDREGASDGGCATGAEGEADDGGDSQWQGPDWNSFKQNWHKHSREHHNQWYYYTSDNGRRPTAYQQQPLSSQAWAGREAALHAGYRALEAAQKEVSGGNLSEESALRGEVAAQVAAMVQLAGEDVTLLAEALMLRVNGSGSDAQRAARRALLLAFHPDKLQHANERLQLLGRHVTQALNGMMKK